MYYSLVTGRYCSMLEVTRMFESCEKVVISRSFILFVRLAMIIFATLMILN